MAIIIQESKMKKNIHHLISQAKDILLKNDMKKTQIRVNMLAFILGKQHAVSKKEIEENLTGQDRITVYRTLKSFEEKEIIHRIQGFEGETKYALSKITDAKDHTHDKPHVHFHCLKCFVTRCLPIKIPEIKMPRNFRAVTTNLAVEGICENCLR
jgi:Fur family ferric uptake transcriptional regulator